MADTWITDITHYLDDLGCMVPESGPVRRFAEYLVSIISMTSHPAPVPVSLDVRCRRRPNRKPCNGYIGGTLDPEADMIIWWCPECGDHGSISNWQGTLWDLSGAGELAH